MKKMSFSALGILVLLALPQTSHSVEVDYYEDAFYKVAENFRNLLRPKLPRPEKDILDDIYFEFSDSENFIVGAYIDNADDRFVVISAGFLASMENLAYAHAVAIEANAEACFFNYIEVNSENINYNTRAINSGREKQHIPSFRKYIRQRRDPACRRISESDLQGHGAFVASSMNSILAFILGHEIAHHTLNHLEKPRGSMQRSRSAETNADRLGLQYAFYARNVPTLYIAPLLLLFSEMDGIDFLDEMGRSHPLGVRRFYAVLIQTLNFIKSSDHKRIFGVKASRSEIFLYETWLQKLKDGLPRLAY